jgi:hypothetical protein
MTFWTESQLEPKRSFKFIMSIAGKTQNIDNFLIKKVNKPSFTISESEHKFLNHSFWYPGKVAWNEVAFTIVDVIGEADGTLKLMKLFEECGYRAPTVDETKGGLQTISKKLSTEALGTIKIQQLNSDGTVVDEWTLWNAWFKDVKFGDLDYDSEDMLNVEVSLRYDFAIYKGGGGPEAKVAADGPHPTNAPDVA